MEQFRIIIRSMDDLLYKLQTEINTDNANITLAEVNSLYSYHLKVKGLLVNAMNKVKK